MICNVKDRLNFLLGFFFPEKKQYSIGIKVKNFGKYFLLLPRFTKGNTQGGPIWHAFHISFYKYQNIYLPQTIILNPENQ